MNSKEQTYNGEQLLSLLKIAHKYCMERAENSILCRLKEYLQPQAMWTLSSLPK